MNGGEIEMIQALDFAKTCIQQYSVTDAFVDWPLRRSTNSSGALKRHLVGYP